MMWARQLPAAPAQALTREQVLRAYTAGSAYAEFAEDTKGRLAPGYVADLAVLSQDVLDETVPVDALPATPSLPTIIGGEADWHRSEEHTSELRSLMRNSYAVSCLNKPNRITSHNRS